LVNPVVLVVELVINLKLIPVVYLHKVILVELLDTAIWVVQIGEHLHLTAVVAVELELQQQMPLRAMAVMVEQAWHSLSLVPL
jgi:hypothetical protein